MAYGQYSNGWVERTNPLPLKTKRKREVFPTDEIPHLWAHKTQEQARNAQGNLFFEGDTIYSYRHNFPIARHVTNAKGISAVLVTTNSYSVTTSRHIHAVRMSIPEGLQRFYVANITPEVEGHLSNVRDYLATISSHVIKASRARLRPGYDLKRATESREECIAYCKFFGLKRQRIAAIPAVDSEELTAIRKRESAKAAKQAKLTRKANQEQAKRDAIEYLSQIQTWMSAHPDYEIRWTGDIKHGEMLAQEYRTSEETRKALYKLTAWMNEPEHADVAAQWDCMSLADGYVLMNKWNAEEAKKRNAKLIAGWLQGESHSLYGSMYDAPTMLRIKGDNVETSRGVNFPVSHAKRGLVLVKAVMAKGEPWKRNGHTCHLGHYQIDSIDANGTVHAGCHEVTWEAIARIESQLLATVTVDENEAS